MAITKQQAIDNQFFHDEKCRTWRKNGQVKTWKRDPNRFYVGVKHGLYDYDYITQNTDTVHIPCETCKR